MTGNLGYWPADASGLLIELDDFLELMEGFFEGRVPLSEFLRLLVLSVDLNLDLLPGILEGSLEHCMRSANTFLFSDEAELTLGQLKDALYPSYQSLSKMKNSDFPTRSAHTVYYPTYHARYLGRLFRVKEMQMKELRRYAVLTPLDDTQPIIVPLHEIEQWLAQYATTYSDEQQQHGRAIEAESEELFLLSGRGEWEIRSKGEMDLVVMSVSERKAPQIDYPWRSWQMYGPEAQVRKHWLP